MSTLDRYVFREIAVPIVVGLGLFFVVVTFVQLFTISDAVTGLGITGPDLLQALIYSLPPLTGLLLPASALFATLLAIGRMSGDREVTALSSVGVSPYRLLLVPGLLGVLLGAISCYALVVGEPWGVKGLRALMARGAQRALASGVRPDEFQEWVPGVTLSAARERHGKDLTDVMLADRRDPDRGVVITAKNGVVVSGTESRDIVFNMRDGSIVVHDQSADSARVIRFETSGVSLRCSEYRRQESEDLCRRWQAKNVPTLWRDMHDDIDAMLQTRAAHGDLESQARVADCDRDSALPAVPLACSRTGGRGRAAFRTVSSALVAAYYYIGRWAELSARSGNFNAWLAAWLPNILGVIGMVIMLVRFRDRAA